MSVQPTTPRVRYLVDLTQLQMFQGWNAPQLPHRAYPVPDALGRPAPTTRIGEYITAIGSPTRWIGRCVDAVATATNNLRSGYIQYKIALVEQGGLVAFQRGPESPVTEQAPPWLIEKYGLPAAPNWTQIAVGAAIMFDRVINPDYKLMSLATLTAHQIKNFLRALSNLATVLDPTGFASNRLDNINEHLLQTLHRGEIFDFLLYMTHAYIEQLQKKMDLKARIKWHLTPWDQRPLPSREEIRTFMKQELRRFQSIIRAVHDGTHPESHRLRLTVETNDYYPRLAREIDTLIKNLDEHLDKGLELERMARDGVRQYYDPGNDRDLTLTFEGLRETLYYYASLPKDLPSLIREFIRMRREVVMREYPQQAQSEPTPLSAKNDTAIPEELPEATTDQVDIIEGALQHLRKQAAVIEQQQPQFSPGLRAAFGYFDQALNRALPGRAKRVAQRRARRAAKQAA